MTSATRTPTAPPRAPRGGEWLFVGHACVDSGTLAIIDPCYVISRGEEIYGWENWHNLFEPYCDNLGVQFTTGFGDGAYEVWAYVVEMGPWGRRVAQVSVCMIAEGDSEDEE